MWGKVSCLRKQHRRWQALGVEPPTFRSEVQRANHYTTALTYECLTAINTIQYNTIQYDTIRYDSIRCNAMQCIAKLYWHPWWGFSASFNRVAKCPYHWCCIQQCWTVLKGNVESVWPCIKPAISAPSRELLIVVIAPMPPQHAIKSPRNCHKSPVVYIGETRSAVQAFFGGRAEQNQTETKQNLENQSIYNLRGEVRGQRILILS